MIYNISLGTAQFGFDYGITNKTGKINDKEVKRILEKAEKESIEYLDTAKCYFKSEEVLGNNIKSKNKFKIISKIYINALRKNDPNEINVWEENLYDSLKKLKIETLDSLLIHNADCLKDTKNSLIISWLDSIKRRKLVKRVGLSIYKKEDLENIELQNIDIIQLPISIYDQRLLNNGTLKYLKEKNIIVHGRSIFLQGLILSRLSKWPENISEEFRNHQRSFQKYIKTSNTTEIEEVFRFIKALDNYLDTVVVGVSSYKEFCSLVNNWNKIKKEEKKKLVQYEKWAWDKNDDIDPQNWTKS